MKTLLHYFSVILIFQLIAFSAYGQYSLSDVGVSLKEDMIWSDNCKMPAFINPGIRSASKETSMVSVVTPA
jgi:hypothetical protein